MKRHSLDRDQVAALAHTTPKTIGEWLAGHGPTNPTTLQARIEAKASRTVNTPNTPDEPEELHRVLALVREIYGSGEDQEVWKALVQNLRVFVLALRRGRQPKLGEILVKQKKITRDDLRKALEDQIRGEPPPKEPQDAG